MLSQRAILEMIICISCMETRYKMDGYCKWHINTERGGIQNIKTCDRSLQWDWDDLGTIWEREKEWKATNENLDFTRNQRYNGCCVLVLIQIVLVIQSLCSCRSISWYVLIAQTRGPEWFPTWKLQEGEPQHGSLSLPKATRSNSEEPWTRTTNEIEMVLALECKIIQNAVER